MTSLIYTRNCIRAKLQAQRVDEARAIEIMALVDDVYQLGRDTMEAETSIRLDGAREDGYSDGYAEGRDEAITQLEDAIDDRDCLLEALGFVGGELGTRRAEVLAKISHLTGERP